MRVLYSWLTEFVDRLPPAPELAHMLIERGVEAEVLIPLAPAVEGLVAGRIVEQRVSEESPARYLVELDGETKEFGCRASEVPVGYSVFVDPATMSIPTLEEKELSPVRFPLVMPAGRSVQDVAADCILDFALVSNRGDLLSHLGIGREAALASGRELRMPPLAEVGAKAHGDNRPTIELPAPDLCPRYVGCYFEEVRIAPSPDWMAYRLSLCGVSPISNIVDLSNYILLELGQPLHTFDRDLLRGAISARRAEPGERFTAINHGEYELCENHLVIADEKHAVALAGVMGGLDSEIRDSTKQVLLESAYFTPQNNRITSKRLGLQSESSLRFGRGIDPLLPPLASRRFIQLAQDIGAAKYVPSSFVDANQYRHDAKPIRFDCGKINAFLGANLDPANIVDALAKLGLTIKRDGKQFTAVPPSWRHDIAIWEDLAEEALRINLFDSLSAQPLHVPLKSGKLEAGLTFVRQVEDVLSRLGGQQTMSQPFLSPRNAETFFGSGHHLVGLQNPDTGDQAYLHESLLPGMLASAEHNRRHGEQPPLLFEIARVYSTRGFAAGASHTLEAEDATYYEQQALGIVYGDGFAPPVHLPPDFSSENPLYVLKGVIAELLRVTSAGEPEYTEEAAPAMVPGRTFSFQVNGEPLGLLGEIDAAVIDCGDERVAFAQLSLDVLERLAQRHTQFAAYGTYPRIERDLAILMPAMQRTSEALAIISEAGGDLLVDAYPFDIYRGRQIPPDHKSVAFHLVFQSPQRTLTGAEVDERVLAALKALYQRK
ncbi:MAG: phenylalanine--tRNA ligase subunit beta, partial [Candidatus Riflebacteria bacterium RBG_13_59_9]